MTGRKRRRTAAPLGLLLLAVATAASAETVTSIRREMSRVEGQYFALYNKLNTDKQFDMVCRMEAPTGSNFMRRVCQPRYLESAKQTSASERIDAANHAGTPPQAGANVGAAMVGGASVVDTQQDAFRRNMLDVLQKSPELQALGQKRDELQRKLDAASTK
jgi:hypothetical protein